MAAKNSRINKGMFFTRNNFKNTFKPFKNLFRIYDGVICFINGCLNKNTR